MLNIWNNAELHPPPINVINARVSSAVQSEIRNILEDSRQVLKNQRVLHIEAAYLSQFKYKQGARFRNDSGFNYLVKTNSALLRYLNYNLENDIERFLDVMSEESIETWHICLPSKQMLEYLLVKLQGFAKLMCRIVTCCEKAAYRYQQKMNTGHFWAISFAIFAIHSKIWDLCKKLCLQTCNWYDNLIKFIDIFEINGGAWLPAGYVLPKQLKVWLGEEWLFTDQTIHKIKMFKTQNATSVFDLIDLSDDEELHFPVDDADCMIVDENINTESLASASKCNTKIPKFVSSNISDGNLNADIGKAISRHNLSSEIISSNVPGAKSNADIGKAISRNNLSSEDISSNVSDADIGKAILKENFSSEMATKKNNNSNNMNSKDNVQTLKNKIKPGSKAEVSSMALKISTTACENKKVKLKKKKNVKEEPTIIDTQKKKKKKEKSTIVDHSINTIKNSKNINSVENVQILKNNTKTETAIEESLMAVKRPLAEPENKEVEPQKKKKKKEKSTIVDHSINTINNSNIINSDENVQILKNKPETPTEVTLMGIKRPLVESENKEVEPQKKKKKKEKSTIVDHSINTIKNSNNINSVENVQILKNKTKPVTSTEVYLMARKGRVAEFENKEVEPQKKEKEKEKATKAYHSADKGQNLKTKPGTVTEVSSGALKRHATASQNKELQPQKEKKKKEELDNNCHSISAIKNGNDLSCFIKTEQMYRQNKNKKSLSKKLGIMQWNSLRNMMEKYVITLNSKNTNPSQIESTLKKVQLTWNNRINFQNLIG